jgi:hypothetical protein
MREEPIMSEGAGHQHHERGLERGQLNRCIASAAGEIDRITACFDRFAR